MLTDFETAVFVRYVAIDAVVATGIAPKFVLEVLLHEANRLRTAEGTRFIAAVGEIEISLSVGLDVVEVREALECLTRWGWAKKRPEGYEVGYQSAGSSDVFYADEAYKGLDQLLAGIGPCEARVKIAKSWIKKIEEVGDARGF